jgi:hypothetical protein
MTSDDAPLLRAVEQPTIPSVGTGAGEPGLESLHAILNRVAADHDVPSIMVVVDDADLGRQAFRAGPGPHPPLETEPGVHVAPEGEHEDVDKLALHALTAASLRAAVLDGLVSGAAGPELELRRLPGVFLVEITDGDDAVVEVVVARDAPGEIARTALDTARRALGKPVAIVIERLAADAAELEPSNEPDDASRDVEPVAGIELLVVHTLPETREIEVHVAYQDARAVGRAPMAGGLGAAVEATLSALRDLGFAAGVRLGWARTVETTVDPSFVVTVAITSTETGVASYGVASGTSPIDAAARAALQAACS